MNLTDIVLAKPTTAELLSYLRAGSYFRATNPTFGTGIAMGIQTSFSDTANVLFLLTNSSASRIVIPHYLRLVCTAAGATSTSSHLGVVADTINRYSAGGTTLTTEKKNANSGVANTSLLGELRFGVITAAAASAKRQLSRSVLKTQAAPCWVVGDEVLIDFSGKLAGNGALSGAAASRIVVPVGPVALQGVDHSLLVHMWNVANATTAPSWECEFAWWEL